MGETINASINTHMRRSFQSSLVLWKGGRTDGGVDRLDEEARKVSQEVTSKSRVRQSTRQPEALE